MNTYPDFTWIVKMVHKMTSGESSDGGLALSLNGQVQHRLDCFKIKRGRLWYRIQNAPQSSVLLWAGLRLLRMCLDCAWAFLDTRRCEGIYFCLLAWEHGLCGRAVEKLIASCVFCQLCQLWTTVIFPGHWTSGTENPGYPTRGCDNMLVATPVNWFLTWIIWVNISHELTNIWKYIYSNKRALQQSARTYAGSRIMKIKDFFNTI